LAALAATGAAPTVQARPSQTQSVTIGMLAAEATTTQVRVEPVAVVELQLATLQLVTTPQARQAQPGVAVAVAVAQAVQLAQTATVAQHLVVAQVDQATVLPLQSAVETGPTAKS